MCQPYLIQEVRRCQWDSYEKVRTVRRRILSLPFAGRVLGLLEPVYLHQPLSGRADDTFVEDAGWHAAAERYAQFLRPRAGQRMLFLELGVGSNTPVMIKYPFWQMTAQNPEATYACLNLSEAVSPREISHRAICLDGDIGQRLEELLWMK